MKLFIKRPLKLHIKRFFLLLLFSGNFSFALWQQAPTAKNLYEKKCSVCHGKEGSKSFLGAKNLQKSKMENVAILQIILNGKKLMPSYKKKLSDIEIKQIMEYVKTLRK